MAEAEHKPHALLRHSRDPAFDDAVNSLQRVLIPAIIAELEWLWHAARAAADAPDNRMRMSPVSAMDVYESDPALEARFDRTLGMLREALLVAFDEALPDALAAMDAMLGAQFLGMELEGPRSDAADAAGDLAGAK